MTNFFKYLPVSTEDQCWGLHVLNAGCTRIPAGTAYPYSNHPTHHYFNWEKGRILHEYQLIYITKGEGIFESEHAATRTIREGSVIILFPGERHRYKPNAETGWDEFWTGFNGKIMEDLCNEKIFELRKPDLYAGFDETLLNLFIEIINKAKEEKAGYQPLVSGMVMHILGYMHSLSQQGRFEGQDIDSLINKARLIFRTRIEENISPPGVARDLGISYSRFRKIFKEYTGIAPGQFQIQLKIHKAKELLMDPAKSIKEIAYALNFDSTFYFSKLFKEKTGTSPAQYRNSVMKGMKTGKGKSSFS